MNNPAPQPPGPSARQLAVMAKALDHRPLSANGNEHGFLAALAKTRITKKLQKIKTRGDAQAYAKLVARKSRKARAKRAAAATA